MRSYRAWPFLSLPHHPVLSALWALAAHGVLGLFVVWPLVRRRHRRLPYCVVAILGASLVDLDHVIAAHSLSFHRMETMDARPDSHGLLVAGAFAAIAWTITRGRLLAWSIFAVTVAHLLWDAVGGGTPLLYPFSGPEAIPWLVLPGGLAMLFALSALMSRSLPDLQPVSRHSRREAGRFVRRTRAISS